LDQGSDGLSRRGVIAAAGAALAWAGVALAEPAPRAPGAPDGGPAPSGPGAPAAVDGGTPSFTAGEVASAEKLVAVEYTPKERQQMLRTLGDQVAMVTARRRIPLESSAPPATRFDPRLPGFRAPCAKSSLRRSDARVPPLPSADEDVAFAPVWQLSEWIRARQISCERLASIYLDRLRRLGPNLECVARLTDSLAMEQARAADAELRAGKYRGPLHGIPYGAKDLFDTAGTATTWGAEPYRGRVPNKDAWVIQRLREAGAVLLAKTSLGALAYGDIWDGGKTRNPWFPEEGSSGSSAGSAAGAAAGLLGFGLGTETLGSIVSPSMRCGATGLRPTFGRIPRTGAMALCWSLDKIGPLCRSAEDAALVLSVLSGTDSSDPGSLDVPYAYDGRRPVRGLRVGYVNSWFEGNEAKPSDRAALEALRTLGVKLVEISIPDLPYDALTPILLVEAAAAFEELTLSGRDDELKWQAPEAWPNTFRAARFISAVDLVQADRFRRKVMEAMSRAFEGVDAVFGPSFAGPMLLATNFTGHPSLTLRAGFEEIAAPRGLDEEEKPPAAAPARGPKHRVPRGVTIWGHLYDEGTICTLGVALERALGVWQERPPGG